MGRVVKRVPIGMEWPIGKIWFGFLLDSVPCEFCDGTGEVGEGKKVKNWLLEESEDIWESEYCPVCEGEGKVFPNIPIPKGPGYQLWETTSEGSPISPVFETPEELARWLADNQASTFGYVTATYEKWLKMIQAEWAPSAIVGPDGIKSGVEFVGGN